MLNEKNGLPSARDEGGVWLLEAMAPQILNGALVVFKARQALYQVFQGAREIIKQAAKQKAAGMRLGLADLRTGLRISPQGALDEVTLSFKELLNELECIETGDRIGMRRVTVKTKRLENTGYETLAEAIRYLSGRRRQWSEQVISHLKSNTQLRGTAFAQAVSRRSGLMSP